MEYLDTSYFLDEVVDTGSATVSPQDLLLSVDTSPSLTGSMSTPFESPAISSELLSDYGSGWGSLFPEDNATSPKQQVVKSPKSSSSRISKKRQQIEIQNSDDPAEIKRVRNTLAARKSRAKKLERLETLQARIKELEEEVLYWKKQAG